MMDRTFSQLTRTRLVTAALLALVAGGVIFACYQSKPASPLPGSGTITLASLEAPRASSLRYPTEALASRPKLTLAAYDFSLPQAEPVASTDRGVKIEVSKRASKLTRLPAARDAVSPKDNRIATVGSLWSGADYESSWTAPVRDYRNDDATEANQRRESMFRLPAIDGLESTTDRETVEEVAKRQAEASGEPSITPHVASNPDPMRAVNQRAEEMIRNAFNLAKRNATYSARNELIASLRMITQASDLHDGTRQHSDALRRGFKAIEEAEDFQQQGLADLDIQVLVAAHQTPVLKRADLASVTPLVALQQYYTYAQEQLIIAGDEQPTASVAYYGLGRLQADVSGPDAAAAAPQSMVFHQAALMVDPMNYKAANELGVLLAKFGQYTQARDMLVHSVKVVPQPESWRNLAKVHEYLGEQELSRKATYEGELVARGGGGSAAVRWVEPAALAGTIGTSQPPAMTATAPQEVPPSTSRTVSQGESQGLMRFIPFMRRGE